MKELAFLITSSTPFVKKYYTNYKPLFMDESTYFHRFPYFYLYFFWCEHQTNPLFTATKIKNLKKEKWNGQLYCGYCFKPLRTTMAYMYTPFKNTRYSFHVTTVRILFSVTNSTCLCSILIVSRLCNVTNTK